MKILFTGSAATIRPESVPGRNDGRRPPPGFGTGQNNPNRTPRGDTR
jgi:hypothetical protein